MKLAIVAAPAVEADLRGGGRRQRQRDEQQSRAIRDDRSSRPTFATRNAIPALRALQNDIVALCCHNHGAAGRGKPSMQLSSARQRSPSSRYDPLRRRGRPAAGRPRRPRARRPIGSYARQQRRAGAAALRRADHRLLHQRLHRPRAVHVREPLSLRRTVRRHGDADRQACCRSTSITSATSSAPLIGIGGIAATWATARLIAGPRAGLIAAALLAVSGVWYGACSITPRTSPSPPR